MSNESIIQVLLAIIGCLLIALVGYFFKVNEAATKSIKNDVKELTDMFRRHCRNSKIHLQPSTEYEEDNG